jgi:hypothetical protein
MCKLFPSLSVEKLAMARVCNVADWSGATLAGENFCPNRKGRAKEKKNEGNN